MDVDRLRAIEDRLANRALDDDEALVGELRNAGLPGVARAITDLVGLLSPTAPGASASRLRVIEAKLADDVLTHDELVYELPDRHSR